MPSIGRIVQIQLWGHVIDSDGVNRTVANSFCYRLAAVGTGLPTKNQLAIAFNNAWSFASSDISSAWIADRYVVWYPMDSGDVPQTVAQKPLNASGDATRLPLTQAVYAQLVTQTRGKSFYGRKHFGPIPVSDVVGDELTPAAFAQWQADLVFMLRRKLFPTGAGGSEWDPVVWSRKLSPPTGSGLSAVGDVVTGAFVDKTLGQCRNRKARFWEICPCCPHQSLAARMTVTFSAGSNPGIAGRTFDLAPSAFPCQRRSDTFTVTGDAGHWSVIFNCEQTPSLGWTITVQDEFADQLCEETYADHTSCNPFNVQVHGAVTDSFSPHPGSLSDCTITYSP